MLSALCHLQRAKFITKLKFVLSWAVAFVGKYKRHWLISTFLIVLFVVLFAYAVDNPSYNPPKIFSWKIGYSAALGKEVSLEIDQTLKIESENLEIKFLGAT